MNRSVKAFKTMFGSYFKKQHMPKVNKIYLCKKFSPREHVQYRLKLLYWMITSMFETDRNVNR